FNFSVLSGFIGQINNMNRPLAQAILDQCLENSQLRAVLVGLQPEDDFDNKDFERCMRALDQDDVSGWLYEKMLWRETYSLAKAQIIKLAARLLEKDLG